MNKKQFFIARRKMRNNWKSLYYFITCGIVPEDMVQVVDNYINGLFQHTGKKDVLSRSKMQETEEQLIKSILGG